MKVNVSPESQNDIHVNPMKKLKKKKKSSWKHITIFIFFIISVFTSNETYVGKQIDRNVTGVVFSVYENKTTPLDCETHCLNAARTCIAVEVLQINESYWECTATHIHFQEYFHRNMSVQIELIPATDNFTVYVKGLNQSDEGQSQGFFFGGGGGVWSENIEFINQSEDESG